MPIGLAPKTPRSMRMLAASFAFAVSASLVFIAMYYGEAPTRGMHPAWHRYKYHELVFICKTVMFCFIALAMGVSVLLELDDLAKGKREMKTGIRPYVVCLSIVVMGSYGYYLVLLDLPRP